MVEEGIYPDTSLAKEVYANRVMYPDDILLTRVGMFYEVSWVFEEIAREMATGLMYVQLA